MREHRHEIGNIVWVPRDACGLEFECECTVDGHLTGGDVPKYDLLITGSKRPSPFVCSEDQMFATKAAALADWKHRHPGELP